MQQLSTNFSSSSNPNCNNYPGPKYNTVDIYFWMKNKNDKWRPNNNWLLPQNYSKLFIFYMSHHIILVWNIKNILAGIITDNIGQKNAYTSNISYNYNVNQAGWYSLAAENTRQEGRGQRDADDQNDHENTLPFIGRVVGHVRLYGERGKRGGR